LEGWNSVDMLCYWRNVNNLTVKVCKVYKPPTGQDLRQADIGWSKAPIECSLRKLRTRALSFIDFYIAHMRVVDLLTDAQ
jgi:hypothetical protein